MTEIVDSELNALITPIRAAELDLRVHRTDDTETQILENPANDNTDEEVTTPTLTPPPPPQLPPATPDVIFVKTVYYVE